jgi:hypothetical protein
VDGASTTPFEGSFRLDEQVVARLIAARGGIASLHGGADYQPPIPDHCVEAIHVTAYLHSNAAKGSAAIKHD